MKPAEATRIKIPVVYGRDADGCGFKAPIIELKDDAVESERYRMWLLSLPESERQRKLQRWKDQRM